MIKKKNFFLLIFFFISLTTYNLDEQKQSLSIFFPIKNIVIKNTFAIDLIKLKGELEFLKGSSLFFLKEEKIIDVTTKYDFISSIQLKKTYPNTLKVLISEYRPVVTEINEKKRYYMTKKGKKINFVKRKIFENLPVIFGNHKNFSSLFEVLEKSNFNIKKIKAFYYFDVGRWDIELKDKKIIKLPVVNYEKVLMEIGSVLNDSNFIKYQIFDYRIKDQLILQ